MGKELARVSKDSSTGIVVDTLGVGSIITFVLMAVDRHLSQMTGYLADCHPDFGDTED